MARKALSSFHYTPDIWRVSQVRNIGAVAGNAPATDNNRETVTKEGDDAIERWISCNQAISGSERPMEQEARINLIVEEDP